MNIIIKNINVQYILTFINIINVNNMVLFLFVLITTTMITRMTTTIIYTNINIIKDTNVQ